MPSVLVTTWLSYFATKIDALNSLNEELGTSYGHGHLSRWERGEREPNAAARAVMMKRVLPGVLKEHGEATAQDVRAALEKLK